MRIPPFFRQNKPTRRSRHRHCQQLLVEQRRPSSAENHPSNLRRNWYRGRQIFFGAKRPTISASSGLQIRLVKFYLHPPFASNSDIDSHIDIAPHDILPTGWLSYFYPSPPPTSSSETATVVVDFTRPSSSASLARRPFFFLRT